MSHLILWWVHFRGTHRQWGYGWCPGFYSLADRTACSLQWRDKNCSSLEQVILLRPPSSLSHTSSRTDRGLPALPEPSEGWLLLGLWFEELGYIECSAPHLQFWGNRKRPLKSSFRNKIIKLEETALGFRTSSLISKGNRPPAPSHCSEHKQRDRHWNPGPHQALAVVFLPRHGCFSSSYDWHTS